MIRHIARMTSLVLAFGFFFGCTVLENLGGGEETVRARPDSDPRTELREVNSRLDEGDDSPQLYYRKGQLLQELARGEEDPSERTALYRRMRASLEEGRRRAGGGDRFTEEEIDELLKVSWSSEHNRGLQHTGADSSRFRQDFDRAAAHFRNAIAIIPDSAVTYRLKAETHYRSGEAEQALSTLEEARQNISELPEPMVEQLGFLYMEQSAYDKAISVYEEARPLTVFKPGIARALANAYMQAGRHREALEVLRRLHENAPGEGRYALTLATEYYFAGRALLESPPSPPADTSAYRRADALFREAEERFRRLTEEQPDDTALRRQIADFYQNVATLYRGHAGSEGAPRELLKRYTDHYLSSAIPHFEYLAGRGEEEYARRLAAIYRYLGIDK